MQQNHLIGHLSQLCSSSQAFEATSVPIGFPPDTALPPDTATSRGTLTYTQYKNNDLVLIAVCCVVCSVGTCVLCWYTYFVGCVHACSDSCVLSRQGNYIYMTLFIHKGDSKCFTLKQSYNKMKI